MGRLRCFVIINDCGLEPRADQEQSRSNSARIEHGPVVLDEKKFSDRRNGLQPQSTDSALAKDVRSKIMISQLRIEQLRNGLACAESLLRHRDSIVREMTAIIRTAMGQYTDIL